MNKRKFIKLGAQASVFSLLGSQSLTQVLAQSGTGYEEIGPALNTRDSSKVEVLEYFWFGCPHCFAFEPSINRWVEGKPEHVDFVREAPPLNPSWEPHSRAFYAAELMGVTEKLFDPMFDEIHVKGRRMRNPDSIAKFVGKRGIDEEKFRKTMDSFAVVTRMNQAMQMAQLSKVSGVPTIVVNGKYRTGGSLAGSHDAILQVIDSLVAREHALL